MEESSEKKIPDGENPEDFKDFEDEDVTAVPEVEAEEISQADDMQGLSEEEIELRREAEIIAKLTQEAGFGTPEYLMGGFQEETQEAEISEDKENTEEEQKAENKEETEQSAEAEETQENEEAEEGKETEETEETEEGKEYPEELQEKSDNEITEAKTDEDESGEKSEIEPPQLPQEPGQWEELDEDDSVVKKYIFYVSKDFVPLIDSLTPDQRTAYINDAIQRKIDAEYEYSLVEKKKRILTHIIVMIFTFFLVTPLVLFIVHKSIMLTFENYKYSQDNFEKLYKQHFEKDRAYMRSIEYNERHSKDQKDE